MTLSVIILNYNVRHFLELCIDSVIKATKNIEAEIIVVDNNSSDDNVEFIKKKHPNIKLIVNSENLGFPKGNNQGFEVAFGKHVCILNPDTIVSEDTFDKLLDFFKTKSNIGIVSTYLLDGTGYFLPESKRSTPTPWIALTKILKLYQYFPNNRLFNQYYAQHIKDDETNKVEILVGAFMLIKHQVYQQLNGFDENCFMYADDIDLSYRAIKSGLDNYYVPLTKVIHFKGESTQRDHVYVKRFSEAMVYFYKKHFKNYGYFKFFMKIISRFFVKSKAKISQIVFESNMNYLFTEDESLLMKLEQSNLKHIEFIRFKKNNDNIRTDKKSCVYFDLKTIKYLEMINFMTQNKHKNTKFRMISPNRDFVLGSDSSDSKGNVVDLIFE